LKHCTGYPYFKQKEEEENPLIAASRTFLEEFRTPALNAKEWSPN